MTRPLIVPDTWVGRRDERRIVSENQDALHAQTILES